MGPSTTTYEKMPTRSTNPATRKAPEKEWVIPTMKPVITGAATPIRLLTRFTNPPTVAVPPRGLISDTIEDATGAAALTPDSAMVIQATAQTGLVVKVAPNTARPAIMPATITALRTLVS